MKRTSFLIACLAAAALCAARAEPSATEKAAAALRDGFPQAAIAPLEDALRTAPPVQRHALGLLLARAHLDAGRPAAARRALETNCDRRSADTALLLAAALAAQGDLAAAAKLAEPQASKSPDAALLLARIRLEQGDPAKARELLPKPPDPLPDNPGALRLLLDLQLAADDASAAEQTVEAARNILPQAEIDTALGRVRLAQNRPSEAAEIFGAALSSPDLPAAVRDNARLGLARALITLGVDARARDVLGEGLASIPDSPTTRESMDLWMGLQRKLGADPAADLRAWASQKPTRRTTEARLQLAKLDLQMKRADLAGTALAELAADPSLESADKLRALLLLAEARIAAGQSRQALELLDDLASANASPEQTYRLADLRGRALAATGAHRKAYESFARAAASAATPDESASAAANCLVCALAAGDVPLARQSYEILRRANPTSPDLARWAFLIAAAEASTGQIDALASLARRAPSVDYAFQAKLALAEWRLSRGDAAAAERILRTARDEADNGQRAAALAAAEIFAADNSGSLSREDLLAACTSFLAGHPQAPEATEIAFKAAELHSRAGDHAAAESVLAKLDRTAKEPETAALAKFLAAQSAARTMSADGTARAMAWFDELAQGASSLRHRARFEQASILLRERRFKDALTLYDRILAGDAPPEARLAALMEKGDTLFACGADDPANFDEAASIYATVAAETGAPADWRDQAACKRAAALARAGKTAAALAAYREVLARPPEQAADAFWFHKAGIEAGHLLEEQRDWPAAIAVYDQMAQAAGAQREELKQRSRRLRLEHFIWEN